MNSYSVVVTRTQEASVIVHVAKARSRKDAKEKAIHIAMETINFNEYGNEGSYSAVIHEKD